MDTRVLTVAAVPPQKQPATTWSKGQRVRKSYRARGHSSPGARGTVPPGQPRGAPRAVGKQGPPEGGIQAARGWPRARLRGARRAHVCTRRRRWMKTAPRAAGRPLDGNGDTTEVPAGKGSWASWEGPRFGTEGGPPRSAAGRNGRKGERMPGASQRQVRARLRGVTESRPPTPVGAGRAGGAKGESALRRGQCLQTPAAQARNRCGDVPAASSTGRGGAHATAAGRRRYEGTREEGKPAGGGSLHTSRHMRARRSGPSPPPRNQPRGRRAQARRRLRGCRGARGAGRGAGARSRAVIQQPAAARGGAHLAGAPAMQVQTLGARAGGGERRVRWRQATAARGAPCHSRPLPVRASHLGRAAHAAHATHAVFNLRLRLRFCGRMSPRAVHALGRRPGAGRGSGARAQRHSLLAAAHALAAET